MGVIIGCRNRSNAGIDTVTLWGSSRLTPKTESMFHSILE
jgi:hypothetical protein